MVSVRTTLICHTMKKLLLLLISALIFSACAERTESVTIEPVSWDKRKSSPNPADSMINGQTYLSVYSQIYSQTQHRKYDLTATVSLRNTDLDDTIYIHRTTYYNTQGQLIRTFFDEPIFIAPLETVEIVIDETDQEGGTGGNFIFDWAIKPGTNQPLFEGVMISTSGQQGLSFTTQGKRIH